jgi:hypothetical protein
VSLTADNVSNGIHDDVSLQETKQTANEAHNGVEEYVDNKPNDVDTMQEINLDTPIGDSEEKAQDTKTKSTQNVEAENTLKEIRRLCDALIDIVQDSNLIELVEIAKAIRPIREVISLFFRCSSGTHLRSLLVTKSGTERVLLKRGIGSS